MPFPYGGNATYSDLAQKFGWPSVIISSILLPFTWLFTKLLAYPFFLPLKYAYTTRQYAYYLEGGEDIWRQKQYFNKTNECGFFPGWNCYIDKEGEKFYESIYGLINCLDVTFKDDCIMLDPNSLTWIIAKVYFEFPSDLKGHRIRFYFANGGINRYNPFAWMNIIFGISSLVVFGNRGLPHFKSKYPMRTEAENFPEDEDPADIRPDGSMVYTNPESANYGTVN